MPASIKAIDVFIPEYKLTNQELETLVDTSSEWIESRTGIKERRILKEPGKGAAYLGIQAVNNLLKNYSIDPLSINVLICSTCTPEYQLPPTATIIAYHTGLKKAWAFDMNATCSGYIYGLEMAKLMVESGKYKRVLLVNTEKMSSIIDYTDRNSSILFGDAAAATLIEYSDENGGVIDVLLYADGSEAEKIIVKAGGSLHPTSAETVDKREHFFWQEGKTVFKRAVLGMENSCMELLKKNKMEIKEVDYLIAHQANKRILDTCRERMELPEEKMLTNIEKYGNTSSVSIPLCLYEYKNQFKKGDKLLLTAFGSGYTWGAALLIWDC